MILGDIPTLLIPWTNKHLIFMTCKKLHKGCLGLWKMQYKVSHLWLNQSFRDFLRKKNHCSIRLWWPSGLRHCCCFSITQQSSTDPGLNPARDSNLCMVNLVIVAEWSIASVQNHSEWTVSSSNPGKRWRTKYNSNWWLLWMFCINLVCLLCVVKQTDR